MIIFPHLNAVSDNEKFIKSISQYQTLVYLENFQCFVLEKEKGEKGLNGFKKFRNILGNICYGEMNRLELTDFHREIQATST